MRFRSIAHLVVRELLGSELPLNDVRRAETIRGIGLSDAPAYAVPLAKRFDYTNTFFHARPRLDITDIPDSLSHRYRFVISSDVFEHVAPPVSRAFEGARKLLADDGFLVLTVPFSLDADTVEHFPELHDFRIEGRGAAAVLQNRTRDGRTQRFHDLVFHGGQGATLEMRLFARASLERELLAAGFSNVRFCDESYLPFGIVWRHPWSIPIVARP
ncbi:MAG TPA: methyltransferase domain-containing protein [Casimicrobiaceae bacterium]|nr:methyltransferase domain-containing protein [Casimicrobiaceae bacterium]